MQRFPIIAQEQETFTRNEMLVWLLSYSRTAKPAHISQKHRIPPRFAEKALALLVEKGVIRDGRVF